MTVVFAILYLLVHVLILVVLGRFAVDMIQSFARGWRPQGASLVLASSIYAVTDPILNPLRRLIPPLRLGGFALDFGFTLVMFAVIILMYVAVALQQA